MVENIIYSEKIFYSKLFLYHSGLTLRFRTYTHDAFLISPRVCAEDINKAIEKKIGDEMSVGLPLSQARSTTQASSLLLVPAKQKDEFSELKCPTCVYDSADDVSMINAMKNSATFVTDEVGKTTTAGLKISLDGQDLISFKIASFIAATWTVYDKAADLFGYDGKGILPLYPPSIRGTTRFVLTAIASYRLRKGAYPNFTELKLANFELLRNMGVDTQSDRYRRWSNADNASYVQALYTTLRALEKQKLITRKINSKTGQIEEIALTFNGILSEAFMYQR